MYVAVVLVLLVLAGATLVGLFRHFAIPPTLVESIGVNARLQFLREANYPPGSALVMGASVATYNLDTDGMEAAERRPFVNTGAYGTSLDDQLRIYRLLQGRPPPGEVIFVSQYYEYGRDFTGLTASGTVLDRYLSGRMLALEEASYFQLPILWAYATQWEELRGRTHASSVAFNRTGAVPLDMDVRKTDPEHATASILSTRPCVDCTAPLDRLCRAVVRSGQRFTAVIPPVQLRAIADLPRHQSMRADLRPRIRETVAACGGAVIDAADFPEFDDGCFADYSHLNARGMAIFTQLVVDHRAGRRPSQAGAIRCD